MQRLIPLLALLCLVACGGALNPITEEPKVTMKSVALSSVSFTGAEGQLAMDIYNPNAFGLPLTRVDWKLSVGGAQAMDGDISLSQTIPAKASAPVLGQLRIGASSAMLLARHVAEGADDYNIQAVLHFKTRLGDISVDVSHQGKLSDAGSAVASK